MPRYRLFGDTVDVAGMMNTTGDGGYHSIVHTGREFNNLSKV